MILQLFEGDKVRFAAFDAEKDADVFSQWTHDPEYMRMMSPDPARPLSPFHIKKRFEEMEKEAGRDFFYFVIRTREDDRAIGHARFHWIEWNHGNAHFELGIAVPEYRRKGYGSEVLQMLMRYAFEELNLFRVTGHTMEYNTAAQHFLTKHGFALEVRRREALYRDGRYWDGLTYGLLAEEWQAAHAE